MADSPEDQPDLTFVEFFLEQNMLDRDLEIRTDESTGDIHLQIRERTTGRSVASRIARSELLRFPGRDQDSIVLEELYLLSLKLDDMPV